MGLSVTLPRFVAWFGRSSSDEGSSGVPPTPLRVYDAPDGASPSADAALLAQLRAGDVAVFERLYVETAPRLWQFAYRILRSRADAEDVVQDVFHSLWNARETLSIQSSIPAYLYGAVRFRAFRARRDRTRDEAAAERHPEMVVPSADPTSRAAESATFDEAVRQIVDRAKPPARDVVYLRWAHGMSYDDIAATLGVSAAAARQHMHRLLRRFGPAFRRLV